MRYYAGLDVSLNSIAVCIVNQDGDILHEGEIPSEPEAIDCWLKDKGLPMERVGLEAGNTSPWLCHALLALKWPAICIEARHAKAAMAAQTVKTDRNDARGIAHIMRTGWFRARQKPRKPEAKGLVGKPALSAGQATRPPEPNPRHD
jgi:transposase